MKYVRTKDGAALHELRPPRKFYKYVLEGENLYLSGKHRFLYMVNVIKAADTIEELIQDGDLCHLEECAVCRDIISAVRVNKYYSKVRGNVIDITVPGICYGPEDVLELWFPDEKGNYYKVASKKSREEKLELLC